MVLPAMPELDRVDDLAPGEGFFSTPGRAVERFRGDHLAYSAFRDHVEQAMAWRRDHLSKTPIKGRKLMFRNITAFILGAVLAAGSALALARQRLSLSRVADRT